MARIYTRTGDKGETGLFGGKRMSKASPRISAYGSIDELNSALGVVRSFKIPKEIDSLLTLVQHTLFDIGTTLTFNTKHAKSQNFNVPFNAPLDVTFLEKQIDYFDSKNPPLKNFILPGGTKTSAFLHLARTVCRRAERNVVILLKQQKSIDKIDQKSTKQMKTYIIPYLNRLSDLLFVLARYENTRTRKKETLWKSGKK